MSKIILTLVSVILFISGFGQFRVKQPRELQHHYLFSTENPDGPGHIEWGFHDKMIYKDYVRGGSSLKEGRVVKRDSFQTNKPFVFMDSAGLIVYDYETSRGTMSILYNDSVGDIISLVYQLHPMKHLDIYDVVHFW